MLRIVIHKMELIVTVIMDLIVIFKQVASVQLIKQELNTTR